MEWSLEELIGVSGTAEWRRCKAAEYPDDNRNQEAAEILERIANELPALDGSVLHRRIEKIVEDGNWDAFVSEVISDELRKIGFHSWPESAHELLATIASRLGA